MSSLVFKNPSVLTLIKCAILTSLLSL